MFIVNDLFVITVLVKNICFYLKTVFPADFPIGKGYFSIAAVFFIEAPSRPSFNYLKT
jgi:hypothetical protein